MYIPSNLRCHDRGAGTLCAERVTHRFDDPAGTSDGKWVYYQCSADTQHTTGYVDRPVTD
ncbi:hypothetical protein E5720_20205 [Rhodococcus sp. PAMC28707]|nr:hypothetical protein E5769_15320 [Rhodococcus sp. PAMC28705]QCB60453.1 hypothetical protein E5720_20205 [Rhodococcus sp. PAMC28707]